MSRPTIYLVKKKGVGKKKRQKFKAIITPKIARFLTNILKGKPAIGLKKLGKSINISSKSIRTWLKTKECKTYRYPKAEIALSKKNLKDRKMFVEKSEKVWDQKSDEKCCIQR